ncbi:MAG: cytochrome C oxidase subunit IV family protein [Flavobacteriales bacterium]|jgi:cytochrome c oxidase subunit IV|nr:cytochrome C oxidase subunit IV family protein [Flavobacteriales bacterium]NCG29270.1 cytochrome C oxidase subunit IV [Bacteroidota bacterium]MBT3964357.1 cytochrome C oxidase subunit IV family protein [Flavobacteriales bacterium]MBT4705141.1 cytochrome C oxidase subunit IV family protein [Flavobacteriales bacterium]MBT4930161.1 cytochrome C oxidase subunit IV family protein [Flavobacteriales bacterium]
MERDDLIEYSLDAHHSEEEGKKIRKKIYWVTLLLSVITIIEVGMGIIWGKSGFDVEGMGWLTIKSTFIILTILKAGYIVMVFMHLGDERKSLRNIILIPYATFILYLLFILLTESTFIHDVKEWMGWV